MVDANIAPATSVPANIKASSNVSSLSGKRKSATVLVTMGRDSAAKIYRQLKPEEIEMLTIEIAENPNIDADSINDVLSEFYEMCLAQKFIAEGGMDYAKEVLETAFGVPNAQEIIDKVLGSIGSKEFDFMKKIDPKQLFNLIQHENPQTIALILSYATRTQSANIINMLSPLKQVEVVKRIAKMDRTSPDVIKEVEESLKLRYSTLGAKEITDIGGIKYTAELLNAVDRGTEKFIFDELEKNDPDLAADIRKLMFVFEDITILDNFAMQKLIKELDPKDLVIALKNANEDIQAAFFGNMSKRSQDIIQEDMSFQRNLRTRDVEGAQTRIVNKIRELEEAGDIIISRGEGDEFV